MDLSTIMESAQGLEDHSYIFHLKTSFETNSIEAQVWKFNIKVGLFDSTESAQGFEDYSSTFHLRTSFLYIMSLK